MKIIDTVGGLVQLSSIPDSKPTKYQDLLKAVIFIGFLVGAMMSKSMTEFFTARSECNFTYTLREGG